MDRRAIASWGIALFEYLFQVPANRIGYTALSLSQLKILQEVRDHRQSRWLGRAGAAQSRTALRAEY